MLSAVYYFLLVFVLQLALLGSRGHRYSTASLLAGPTKQHLYHELNDSNRVIMFDTSVDLFAADVCDCLGEAHCQPRGT